MKRAPLTAAVAIAFLFATRSAGAATAPAPNACVEYPDHDAYMCVAGLAGDGALYWYDALFTREFYWHPASGDQAVGEVFYCQNDATSADGHTDCKGNAPGVPARTPESSRRVLTLADGCVVSGWKVDDSNTHPPPPKSCASATGRPLRPTTASERRTLLDFWRIMQKVPGQW